MNILYIDDDERLVETVKALCEELDHNIESASNGRDGLIMAQNPDYDIIILDIMLPEINGIDLLKQIRSQNIRTPILMLTALDTVEDKVEALDNGADDYLAKPFSAKELFARARALSRRQDTEINNSLTFENLTFNPIHSTVSFNGTEHKLSNKEARIFEVLLREPNKTLNRNYIINKVWNKNDRKNKENNLEIYIHNIRKKIKGSRVKIDTVRGVGYHLAKNQDYV